MEFVHWFLLMGQLLLFPFMVVAALQVGMALPREQKRGHEDPLALPYTDQATQHDPPLLTLWLHIALAMLIKCHMNLSGRTSRTWVLGGM